MCAFLAIQTGFTAVRTESHHPFRSRLNHGYGPRVYSLRRKQAGEPQVSANFQPARSLNMQHAELNRATIRVADSTDVSGRTTADEGNLDRVQNCKVRAFLATALNHPSLRWMLLVTVLSVTQVWWGIASASAAPPQRWFATVGAQSNDKGHQALAFATGSCIADNLRRSLFRTGWLCISPGDFEGESAAPV